MSKFVLRVRETAWDRAGLAPKAERGSVANSSVKISPLFVFFPLAPERAVILLVHYFYWYETPIWNWDGSAASLAMAK